MRMEVLAIEHTCDGCSKVVIARAEDGVPGITGEAFEENERGGHSAEFWACSRKSVGKAVANALDK